MGMVHLRRELVEALLTYAIEYGRNQRYELADVGAALLGAGAMVVSSGMNDEQVRALLEQAFTFSAPVRTKTAERWERTGFDPYAGERPGKAS